MAGTSQGRRPLFAPCQGSTSSFLNELAGEAYLRVTAPIMWEELWRPVSASPHPRPSEVPAVSHSPARGRFAPLAVVAVVWPQRMA